MITTEWNIALITMHMTACIVMSAVLLSYRQGRSMAERHYRQILAVLAAMISARIIPDILFLVYGYSQQMYDAICFYLRPVISLGELWAGFFVFYRSVHAMAKFLQPLYYTGWAILALLLLHPVLFVESVRWGSLELTPEGYMEYCQSVIGVAQRAAVFAMVTWTFISNVVLLMVMYLRVARSGRLSENAVGHHLRRVFNGCSIVLMIYVTSFTATVFLDSMWWQILMLAVLVLDYSLLAYVLNHHVQFLFYEREVLRLAMRTFRNRHRALPDEIDWAAREQEVVFHLLDEWSKRDDRPFDSQDLTLEQVANDLHLPPDVLCRDGMNMYGVRFEEYICLLRGK